MPLIKASCFLAVTVFENFRIETQHIPLHPFLGPQWEKIAGLEKNEKKERTKLLIINHNR
jgi:hypothetical protein